MVAIAVTARSSVKYCGGGWCSDQCLQIPGAMVGDSSQSMLLCCSLDVLCDQAYLLCHLVWGFFICQMEVDKCFIIVDSAH